MPHRPTERSFPVPSDERERLWELASFELLDTPREPLYDGIVEIAAALLDVPIAKVSLVDRDRQWFKATVGFEVCETGRDVSFCTHAIMEPKTLVVEDATLDPRFCDSPLVTGYPHVRFYAGVPLTTYRGQRIGALCAIDTRPRTIEPAKLRLLERLASVVVESLENRRDRALLFPSL